MRLVKSEDEEEESTMETLMRKREIWLFTKLLLPPTTAIGGVDLGMSAKAQQEEAHREPDMKVKASVINMWWTMIILHVKGKSFGRIRYIDNITQFSLFPLILFPASVKVSLATESKTNFAIEWIPNLTHKL